MPAETAYKGVVKETQGNVVVVDPRLVIPSLVDYRITRTEGVEDMKKSFFNEAGEINNQTLSFPLHAVAVPFVESNPLHSELRTKHPTLFVQPPVTLYAIFKGHHRLAAVHELLDEGIPADVLQLHVLVREGRLSQLDMAMLAEQVNQAQSVTVVLTDFDLLQRVEWYFQQHHMILALGDHISIEDRKANLRQTPLATFMRFVTKHTGCSEQPLRRWIMAWQCLDRDAWNFLRDNNENRKFFTFAKHMIRGGTRDKKEGKKKFVVGLASLGERGLQKAALQRALHYFNTTDGKIIPHEEFFRIFETVESVMLRLNKALVIGGVSLGDIEVLEEKWRRILCTTTTHDPELVKKGGVEGYVPQAMERDIEAAVKKQVAATAAAARADEEKKRNAEAAAALEVAQNTKSPVKPKGTTDEDVGVASPKKKQVAAGEVAEKRKKAGRGGAEGAGSPSKSKGKGKKNKAGNNSSTSSSSSKGSADNDIVVRDDECRSLINGRVSVNLHNTPSLQVWAEEGHFINLSKQRGGRSGALLLTEPPTDTDPGSLAEIALKLLNPQSGVIIVLSDNVIKVAKYMEAFEDTKKIQVDPSPVVVVFDHQIPQMGNPTQRRKLRSRTLFAVVAYLGNQFVVRRAQGEAKSHFLGSNPFEVVDNVKLGCPAVTGTEIVAVMEEKKGNKPSRFRGQRPIVLYKEFIEIYTELDGLVIDPFFGIGTCAVAALTLGRRFFGNESTKGLYDVAEERVKNTVDLIHGRQQASRPTSPTGVATVPAVIDEHSSTPTAAIPASPTPVDGVKNYCTHPRFCGNLPPLSQSDAQHECVACQAPGHNLCFQEFFREKNDGEEPEDDGSTCFCAPCYERKFPSQPEDPTATLVASTATVDEGLSLVSAGMTPSPAGPLSVASPPIAHVDESSPAVMSPTVSQEVPDLTSIKSKTCGHCKHDVKKGPKDPNVNHRSAVNDSVCVGHRTMDSGSKKYLSCSRIHKHCGYVVPVVCRKGEEGEIERDDLGQLDNFVTRRFCGSCALSQVRAMKASAVPAPRNAQNCCPFCAEELEQDPDDTPYSEMAVECDSTDCQVEGHRCCMVEARGETGSKFWCVSCATANIESARAPEAVATSGGSRSSYGVGERRRAPMPSVRDVSGSSSGRKRPRAPALSGFSSGSSSGGLLKRAKVVVGRGGLGSRGVALQAAIVAAGAASS